MCELHIQTWLEFSCPQNHASITPSFRFSTCYMRKMYMRKETGVGKEGGEFSTIFYYTVKITTFTVITTSSK